MGAPLLRRDEFLFSLAAPVLLPPAHTAAVNRRRRMCVQLDAADHRHVKLPPSEWIAYVFRYADMPGSQIDSIWLDIGIPENDVQVAAWRERGFEWKSALVATARKRNLEVFWNHRFSEVDITPEGGLDMDQLNPVKAAHPDWVIRSWWWQGLWNAASPGLREYKVAELRKLAESLDLDGIQIDFARHIPCLPPGRQWELRDHVTAFLRMMRQMLLDVARRRGKPYLLAAKIPETLRGCRTDGFDVETWARENLVDILTLGSRTMTVDVEDFRRVTAGRNIKLSPCLDDHHATDGYRYPPIEFFRGVFGNWLAQGADSVTTFNWAVAPGPEAGPVGGRVAPDSQRQAYLECGTLATMEGKSRLFAVERRGGYPWAEGYHNRNDWCLLPAKLANDGRPAAFPIRTYVSRPAEATLRVVVFQYRSTDRLEVRFNDRVLSESRAEDWKDPQIFSPRPQPNSGGKGEYTVNPAQRLTRLHYAIDPAMLTRGRNNVDIRVVSRAAYRIGEDIQVEKVEVHC